VGNDFKKLIAFLERFEPEVTGRQTDAPPQELRRRFDKFIEGECSGSEVETLCAVLRTQPVWLDWVVQRVKEKRDDLATANRPERH
jgi:hypothetical protein